MQENIKEFKKRLRAMGFKRKSDRVYWYDNNGLFYVVSFKMEGKEVNLIGFEVSHAGMFEDGVPQQRCSPVGGWLGLKGVASDSPLFVKDTLPDADFLERAAREFFSYFKTAADWQTAIRGLHEKSWPRFTEVPVRPDAGGAPVPWFVNNDAGELQTRQDFMQKVQALLAAHASGAGFQVYEDNNDCITYARQRGEIYDCFFVIGDELGTFFCAVSYAWSDRFADEEWGKFFSFFGGEYVPASRWIRTADALRDARLLDVLFEETSAFCAQFMTACDWADYIEKEQCFLSDELPKLKALAEGRVFEPGPLPPPQRELASNPPPAAHVNSIGMEFMRIPAGTFLMGAADDECATDWECPQREVRLTRAFLLGKYPVTQAQWEAVMGNNPSHFKGDERPVDSVSWDDAQAFIRKLNEMEGHERYRLPTEAEWEYACRAGGQSMFCFGDDVSILGEYAWYEENAGGMTHWVGEKKPNAWGLYDMHGNILEWVQDRDGKYRIRSVVDPTGSTKGEMRMLRGGDWSGSPGHCRSAHRCSMTQVWGFKFTGFRLALSVDE